MADRYEVLDLIGQGGMGEVYRVRDAVAGTTLALKRLRKELAEVQPTIALLFEREYHTLQQLAHPRIIHVLDYGVDVHGPYYTMELLAGDDLHTRAPLPWREACAVIRDVASSLAIIHSRRLLHRDVSPRNVRLGPDGRAKLLDFGAMATMGVSGELIGTPPCIAPEVVHGQPLDARADLFALGALAYWALTGGHAYPASTVGALRDIWRSRPRAPSSRAAGIPRELDRLVLSLLALDPLARPVSAGEVIERLTVIAELPVVENLDVVRAYLAAPTLVGRDQQVLRCRKQVLRAGRGRGSVTLLEAPAGRGRTRLLRSLELEGKLAGAAVLRADAGAVGDQPLGVMRALCHALLELVPERALAAARPLAQPLASALDEVAHALGMPPHQGPLSGEQMALAENALCEWLIAISQKQPLVIAVDDAHLADESSLTVLVLLAREAPEQRIALTLSLLAGAQPSAPGALELVRRKATVLELPPLEESQTQELARSLFGDVQHVSRVAAWMHRLGQGNPRTCMQLAQHLVDQQLARYEHGAWLLPASLRGQELPSSVEETLERTLGQLSGDALTLLRGLALSSVRLRLDEYPLLLQEDPADSPAVFAALDELVAAGILITQDDTYALAQGGYRDAVRRSLPDAVGSELHRRLARIAERRGDPGRQAAHLLYAGDELAALEAQLELDRGFANAYRFDRPVVLRRIPGEAQEDSTEAVHIRERLIAVCEGLGRPPRETFALRAALLTAANYYDSSLSRGHMGPQLARLRFDSGAIYWDELADAPSHDVRAQRCLARAQEVYDATSVAERGLTPQEALGAMVVTIGQCHAMARHGYETTWFDEMLELSDFFRSVLPRAQIVRDATEHALALIVGRQCAAAALRERMLTYYDGQLASAEHVAPLSRIGRAIALQVEGAYRACFGGDAAARLADELEKPLFDDPARDELGAYIWRRRAWEVRRLMHLYNGDAAGARDCQEQIDRLSVRHAYAAYGSGISFLEAWAFAMSGDLTGLKQSIEAIAQIVERQFPGWQPFLDTATAAYHRLRGEPERARELLQQALRRVGPGTHAAWAPATELCIETLLDLGEVERARELAGLALRQCRHAELGFLSQLGLERVLALSEAYAGETQVAAERLERLVEHAAGHAIAGVRRGALLEARARVAVLARDHEAFARFAAQTADLYRAGRNPALVARYERLIHEARAAEITLSHELTHAADIVSALGLGEAAGFHTVFESCADDEQRREKALQLMLERTGAQSGFLYSVSPDGALALVASQPPAQPPAELSSALEAYVKAELDQTVDVTMTCFDEGVRTTDSGGGVSAYRPVLLSEVCDGARVVRGIAALLCEGEYLPPQWDVVSAVTGVLDRADEVVSMFG